MKQNGDTAVGERLSVQSFRKLPLVKQNTHFVLGYLLRPYAKNLVRKKESEKWNDRGARGHL